MSIEKNALSEALANLQTQLASLPQTDEVKHIAQFLTPVADAIAKFVAKQ